jgi:ribonuclease HI
MNDTKAWGEGEKKWKRVRDKIVSMRCSKQWKVKIINGMANPSILNTVKLAGPTNMDLFRKLDDSVVNTLQGSPPAEYTIPRGLILQLESCMGGAGWSPLSDTADSRWVDTLCGLGRVDKETPIANVIEHRLAPGVDSKWKEQLTTILSKYDWEYETAAAVQIPGRFLTRLIPHSERLWIWTDGGVGPKGGRAGVIISQVNPRFMTDDNSLTIGVDIPMVKDANLAEWMGVAVATHVCERGGKVTIFMDSKAVLEPLQRGDCKARSKLAPWQRNTLDYYERNKNRISMEWIPSHQDRYNLTEGKKKRIKELMAQFGKTAAAIRMGNVWADRIAGGERGMYNLSIGKGETVSSSLVKIIDKKEGRQVLLPGKAMEKARRERISDSAKSVFPETFSREKDFDHQKAFSRKPFPGGSEAEREREIFWEGVVANRWRGCPVMCQLCGVAHRNRAVHTLLQCTARADIFERRLHALRSMLMQEGIKGGNEWRKEVIQDCQELERSRNMTELEVHKNGTVLRALGIPRRGNKLSPMRSYPCQQSGVVRRFARQCFEFEKAKLLDFKKRHFSDPTNETRKRCRKKPP